MPRAKRVTYKVIITLPGSWSREQCKRYLQDHLEVHIARSAPYVSVIQEDPIGETANHKTV